MGLLVPLIKPLHLRRRHARHVLEPRDVRIVIDSGIAAEDCRHSVNSKRPMLSTDTFSAFSRVPESFCHSLRGWKDVLFHSSDQGGKMQKSQDFEKGLSAALLDAVGGEPLAGSGFETEDPEAGFSTTEAAVQE
jgi:hypothetical protein